ARSCLDRSFGRGGRLRGRPPRLLRPHGAGRRGLVRVPGLRGDVARAAARGARARRLHARARRAQRRGV
ncbi:MAG: hypothetical protein AVDCRST_MAG13-1582, partial [uncultured Solirubrobacteraceae bacterium]